MAKSAHAPLLAPFPWFGGKSRATAAVNEALGAVHTYCEPFAGSLGVLLQRAPVAHEVANDIDGHLVNVWRALAAVPEEVAHHVDWPVTELDLTARHALLVREARALRVRMEADPLAYDARLAGWWLWGVCAWLGSGWCTGVGAWDAVGVGTEEARLVRGGGVARKLPHISDTGRGVHRGGGGVARQLPHLSDTGMGVHRGGGGGGGVDVLAWCRALQERLRRVRITCGDFERVLSNSALHLFGRSIAGVLLDPPYPAGADASLYGECAFDAWQAATAWAAANGERFDMRIIIMCGYEGMWEPPAGWTTRTWHNLRGHAKEAQRQEVLWCSPGCVPPLGD